MSAELVEALRRRLGARVVETHLSWVLLAGEHAWKIKKPVQLGFVDFGTLDARQHMCEEELRLNRRLAPALYLEVVPICGTAQVPELGGAGAPIEWALHMRRFPDGALLCERLAAHDLPPALIDRLACRLTAFHHEAPCADPAGAYGSPERIDADMRAVIQGLAEHPSGNCAEEDTLQRLRGWAIDQAIALRGTWIERLRSGCVREGHGDLHLANVVVLADDVTAFDCIEFDPALRWIDMQADIGFLVMDLLAHERSDLAFRFLDHYLTDGGDHNGLAVLRYYVVYRALVRALVASLQPAAAAQPDYLALALRWLQAPGARLMITHGLSGSGKSFAAGHLLERAGAVRLRSDVERKRLFGLAALAGSASSGADGIYGPDATRRTYARLEALAGVALQAGWPVIIDATFLCADERDAFRRLAQRHGAPFTILHCEAPVELLRRRLCERARRSDDPSEADAAVLAHQQDHAEALTGAERAATIVVDGTAAFDAEALAARWRNMR
jgi:aminoglycoside phosphotransferase family enzyme/predicted kinase